MSNCEKIIELEKRIKELEDRLRYPWYPIPYYPTYPTWYGGTTTDTADTAGTVEIVWGDVK